MENPSDPTCWQRSVCQCLAHYARHRPTTVAVVYRNLRVTYESLAAHVLAVADYLTVTGIRSGQVMGVETGDRYEHLVILLAAEVLGITTMSVAPSDLGPPANLDRLCDRLMMTQPSPKVGLGKFVPMPREGIVAAYDRLNALERDSDPDFLMRLIKSSGTTGAPKVMGMTRRVLQRLNQKAALQAPPWVTANPVYLCVYNFSVRASHARAMLTLQLGGTVHFTGTDVLWDLVQAGIGNHLIFVTGHLERFLRSAPPGRGPSELYLDVIGAAVPPWLRQEIRAKLTEHYLVTYSSNETNRVSLVGDDNVGTLLPDARVRIVDEHGKPVQVGEPGLIWVRTDTMTQGYVGAPELTRAAFVDGWFCTSDVGFQPSEGKLVVLGRNDDMLNLGGLKIAPGPIEHSLKRIVGVRDVLVSGIEDQQDIETMLVAIEMAPDAMPADLAKLITPILAAQAVFFHLAFFADFPRTDTGKIRREAVKDLYRRQAQRV